MNDKLTEGTGGGNGPDNKEIISENEKKELHEDLIEPPYLSGEYFLKKIKIDETQMQDKITKINNLENEIKGINRERLEYIIGKKIDDEGRKDFEEFKTALTTGQKEIDNRMQGGRPLTKLIEGHTLELFHKKNEEKRFSLVSLANRFLFTKLIEIKADLKQRLGKEYKDDYLLLRKYRITLGKIGPKALEFLLSDKLSVENVVRNFRKLKEKSKDKYKTINYGFIERSMIRWRKEDLDEKVIDKIKITELPDEKAKEALKKTYLYKVLFPHFCNHAPGSFDNSLKGKPEEREATNQDTPTGFFITNDDTSQLFYFKIDQNKKSILDLKNNKLGGINDYDNLLMRELSQEIKKTLSNKERAGGTTDRFNYSQLTDKEIEAINTKFTGYCDIQVLGGCIVVKMTHEKTINFEKTNREQSDRLIERKLTPEERKLWNCVKKYKVYGVQKCFEKLKEWNILKSALSALIAKGINENTFKDKLIGIRGTAFTVGIGQEKESYSFQILDMPPSSGQEQNFKDYNDLLKNGFGGVVSPEKETLAADIQKAKEKSPLTSNQVKLDLIDDIGGGYKKYNIVNNQGKAIGFVNMRTRSNPDHIEIIDIEIKPKEMNNGYGKAVYKELVRTYQLPILSYKSSPEADRVRDSLGKEGLMDIDEYGGRMLKVPDIKKTMQTDYTTTNKSG